jgi:hypothetical protein
MRQIDARTNLVIVKPNLEIGDSEEEPPSRFYVYSLSHSCILRDRMSFSTQLAFRAPDTSNACCLLQKLLSPELTKAICSVYEISKVFKTQSLVCSWQSESLAFLQRCLLCNEPLSFNGQWINYDPRFNDFFKTWDKVNVPRSENGNGYTF